MTPETYRLIHVIGVLCLFIGLGGLLASEGKRGPFFALHGLGLVAMAVAGVGFLHKSGVSWPWPGWVLAKIGCWLLLALLPALVKRGIVSRPAAVLLVLAVGGAAVWLVQFKPF